MILKKRADLEIKMSDLSNIWKTLSVIDVNKNTKKVGRYTYLSWSWAWATLMDSYPEAYYKFEPPAFFSDGSCEVWVTIHIGELSHSMWLPVMDHKNKPVMNPDSRKISDTRMRCLTKCMAMFGLGHYIYAGDSFPTLPPAKPSFTKDMLTAKLEFFTADIGTGAATAEDIIKQLERDYTVGEGAKKAIKGIK
jgi:hypothetical protein